MILIINRSKRDAISLAEMFYLMGILAYGATPSEALSEISLQYKIAIVMSPSTLPDKCDYAARLRSYASIPIAVMTDEPDERDTRTFDLILKQSTYAARLMDTVRSFFEARNTDPPGTYRLDGIRACAESKVPTFLHSALPLTKTETMVLRILIKAYPRPIRAAEILKYAFRQSRYPDVSNVRTHVSLINRKYRELRGENLITFLDGEGYVILTPSIINKRDI